MPDVALFTGEQVERIKIREYFNDYYLSAVQVYNEFKRYGLPWHVGYMEIPEYLKKIYDIFDEVISQHRTWKMKRLKNGSV